MEVYKRQIDMHDAAALLNFRGPRTAILYGSTTGTLWTIRRSNKYTLKKILFKRPLSPLPNGDGLQPSLDRVGWNVVEFDWKLFCWINI